MTRAPVVAVINTSPDIIDLLRYAFELAGFVVVAVATYAVRDGEVDLERFLQQHHPDVIVYDVAPPYEANWRLFQHICEISQVASRPIVLTSTNPKHVLQFVEKGRHVHEIIGKPYDLEEIVNVVRGAVGTR